VGNFYYNVLAQKKDQKSKRPDLQTLAMNWDHELDYGLTMESIPHSRWIPPSPYEISKGKVNDVHSMWNESYSMWNESHSMWSPCGVHMECGGTVKY